jgi:TPR repeat protein
VEQDKRRAFELYNTAAEQGHKQAWRNLAAMYLAGDGVPQSEEVARQIASVILKGDRNEGDGEAK